MRKFNHWETLKIAFNVIYVVSFLALLAFTISTYAKELQINYQSIEQEMIDCENCDEID